MCSNISLRWSTGACHASGRVGNSRARRAVASELDRYGGIFCSLLELLLIVMPQSNYLSSAYAQNP